MKRLKHWPLPSSSFSAVRSMPPSTKFGTLIVPFEAEATPSWTVGHGTWICLPLIVAQIRSVVPLCGVSRQSALAAIGLGSTPG